MKIIITGASGLLGRAVLDRFVKTNHSVTGLSFTRQDPRLERIDLRDEEKVADYIHKLKPDVLIHCAAERRPDVAEKDHDSTQNLNVEVTKHLAKLANQLGFKMIYICTDYIFDGNAPEGGYDADATPNPTNFYARTKLAGERVMLGIAPQGKAVSLRVPVLYGKAENNNESAINVLLEGVKKAAKNEKVLMDDWATRFPTLVDDVANVLVALAEYKDPLPPRLNFSSQTKYTKYSISLIFGKLLNLTDSQMRNLIPQSDPPEPGETMRPRDCRLSNQKLESLEIPTLTVDFVDWWQENLNTT